MPERFIVQDNLSRRLLQAWLTLCRACSDSPHEQANDLRNRSALENKYEPHGRIKRPIHDEDAFCTLLN
jgi:hypothetical protein